MYLLGADEAGYGPNLGPLVVSASLWEIDPSIGPDGLYDRLDGAITAAAARCAAPCALPVAMADSKALYQSGGGLAGLERGLLTALALLGHRPRDWDGLWNALSPACVARRDAEPWHRDYRRDIPADLPADAPAALAAQLGPRLTAAGMRLVALRSRVVFAEEFNELVDAQGNKGAVLSHLTLGVVADLIAPLPCGPIVAVCDKHGGRNRYAPLLETHFPEAFVEVCGEGRSLSVYRFGPTERRIEFRFRVGGERCLPAALASMASKYLRELSMEAFNAFWQSRVPGLAPTAGYPLDAARFRRATADALRELGIAERRFWRSR